MRQVNIPVWALIFASSEPDYIWRLLKDAGLYAAESDIKSCLLFWAFCVHLFSIDSRLREIYEIA